MLLSGKQILAELNSRIKIEPFNPKQVGPNSYNLRLSEELLVYTDPCLDMAKANATRKITIPPEGLVLQPGVLYLGRTIEHTETQGLVPMLEGRSSIGRLGLFVHVTAGFGDVGFKGIWTLEISCIQPIRIYAGVEVCQIFYHEILGDFDPYSSKKYQANSGIQASRLFEEFS